MALQFRKSKQIFPGVKLNFSKSGISTSFGVRGARLTFGKRGVTTSLGIPGTGLFYRSTTSSKLPKKSSTSYNKEFYNKASLKQHINSANYSEITRKRSIEKKLGLLYQWRLCTWILATFLCLGFLMGGNPDWSLGTIVLAIIVTYLINKKIKSYGKRINCNK